MANSCMQCPHCQSQAAALEGQAKRMDAFEAAVAQLKRLGYTSPSFEQAFTHALWLAGGSASIGTEEDDDS